MIMMDPYRRPLGVSCRLPICSPMTLSRFVSSWLAVTWLFLHSRTFNILPLSGKTPYLSLPTTDNPAMHDVLAESPSVMMRVHCSAYRPPASLASSNLGMPVSCFCPLVPPVFILRCRSKVFLPSAQRRTLSTMPELQTCLRALSEMVKVEPNLAGLVVNVSLICESNAGFSMRQLMNTHRWFLMCIFLTSTPFLFFCDTFLEMAVQSWSTT
mmetsp:Transcript_45949/g.114223  ORF Transcript_45949/g.114223 Transcript_45949/m.114223 type:complete len:212 (+) Transcript_45949:3656-4291(+)